MLALRWSFAKDLFLVALLGATTLVAAAERHRDHDIDQSVAPIHSVRVSLVAPHSHGLGRIDYCAMAEERYRRHDFFSASWAMQQAARLDPSLAPRAELYVQLARAWRNLSSFSFTQRFETLRYARRLDLSLGGLWADELDGKMRHVAPQAAYLYFMNSDQHGYELALATCDALGVKPYEP